MSTSKLRVVLAVLALVLLASSSAFGQAGATGTILGTVSDNSGVSMVHASIALTNTASGVTKRTGASSAGDFAFEYMTPGTYDLEVTSEGFGKVTIKNITLVVAQRIREDIKMKQGEMYQTVVDAADTVQLDTDSSTVSQTVAQQQVNGLP